MFKFNKHLIVLSLSIFTLLTLVGNAYAYDWAGKQPEISASTMAANPNNHTPVIQSLSASAASVDSGGNLQLTATASDPDGDSLTYFWSAPKGEFASCSGACSGISWIAPSVSTSTSVTISLEVGDKKGRAAWRTVTVTVRPGGSGNDDTTDPVVAMSEPAGGNYTEGDLLTARWSAFDDTGLSHFVLEKYLSSSAVWQTISSSIAGDLTSISWTAELGVTKLRITAYDEAGNHASATSANFTVTAEPCPTSPDAPTLKNPGVSTPNNFVRVQWYGVDCSEEYTLFVGKGDAYTEYTTVTVDAEEYLLANLSNDTYYFKVKARNSHGESGWSPVKFITVAMNHPPYRAFHPYPVDGATNVQRQNLTLAWDIDDDPDDDIITSAPYLGTSPNNMTRKQGFSNVLTYDCATLDACTTYYWRIDTRDPDDFITTGSTWTFTTECNQADVSVVSISIAGDIRLYNDVTATVVVQNVGGYRSKAGLLKLYISATPGQLQYLFEGYEVFVRELNSGESISLTKTVTLDEYIAETFYFDAHFDPGVTEDGNLGNNTASVEVTFEDTGEAPELSWVANHNVAGREVDVHDYNDWMIFVDHTTRVPYCDFDYQNLETGQWEYMGRAYPSDPNCDPSCCCNYVVSWMPPESMVNQRGITRATCADSSGNTASEVTNWWEVLDYTPPTGSILWPTGGEELYTENTYTIRFTGEAACIANRADIRLVRQDGWSYGFAYAVPITDGMGEADFYVRSDWFSDMPYHIELDVQASPCHIQTTIIGNNFYIHDGFQPPPGFSDTITIDTGITYDEYSAEFSNDNALVVAAEKNSSRYVGSTEYEEHQIVVHKKVASNWTANQITSYAESTSYYHLENVMLATGSDSRVSVAWNRRDPSYDAIGLPYVARFDGDSWGSEVAIPDCDGPTQCYLHNLAVFPNGDTIVFFINYDVEPDQLVYRILYTGGAWSAVSTLIEKNPQRVGVKVDSQGVVHVYYSFYDQIDNISVPTGIYQSFDGLSWSDQDVLDPGRVAEVSMELDSQERPVIMVWGSGRGLEKILRKDIDDWTNVPVPEINQTLDLLPRYQYRFTRDDNDSIIVPWPTYEGSKNRRPNLRWQTVDGWSDPLHFLADGSVGIIPLFDSSQEILHFVYYLSGGTLRYGYADWSVDRQNPVAAFNALAQTDYGFGYEIAFTWTASDDSAVSSQTLYWVEADGTEHEIEGIGSEDRSYTWTAPDAPYLGATFKLVVTDDSGNEGVAISDAFNVKENDNPAVAISNPQAGDFYYTGTGLPIEYEATDNLAVDYLDFYWRVSEGSAWQEIATGQANTGQYLWSIPYEGADSAQVKVVAVDTSGNQAEAISGAFTIIYSTEPQLQLYDLDPADGALQVASTLTLSWKTVNGTSQTASYDVYLSDSESDVSNLSSAARVSNDQSAQSYAASSLDLEASYFWRIVATAGTVTSDSGLRTFTTAGELVAAPSNLQATGADNASASMSWQDNSDNEQGFVIEYSTDGDNYAEAGSVAADVTTFEHTGLDAHTGYWYRVYAQGATNRSVDSNTLYVETENTPPNAPVLTAPAVGAQGVPVSGTALSWTVSDPDSDDLVSDVYLGLTPDPPLADSDLNAFSYSISTLQRNKVYYWKIVARDAFEGEASSAVQWFVTEGYSVPLSPTDFSAAANGAYRIDLSWQAADDQAETYRIERACGRWPESVGDWYLLDEVSAAYTAYSDLAGLIPAHTCNYRLMACNPAGCSTATAGQAATLDNTGPVITPAIPTIRLAAGYTKDVALLWHKQDETDWGEDLSWSAGTDALGMVTVGLTGDTLSLTATGDAGDTEITLTLHDANGATTEQTVSVSVVSDAEAPVWEELPAIYLRPNEYAADALDLWAFVEDGSVEDSVLSILIHDTTNTGCGALVNGERMAEFDPEADFVGSCEVTYRADNGILFADAVATVYVGDWPDGIACESGEDCASEYCANGFCCEDGVCCQKTADCLATFDSEAVCDDAATCSGSHGEKFCDEDYQCATNTVSDPGACADLICNADDDGCTVDDTCNAEGACIAGAAPDCSEQDDACNTGACESTDTNAYQCIKDPTLHENTSCNADDDGCTIDDYCSSGACVVGMAADCSDLNDQCNTGVCQSNGENAYECITDWASHEDAACNDADLCTTDDACDGGQCVGATVDCSDAYDCTEDACNPETGDCEHTPDNAVCDDLNDCTEDVCLADSGCGYTDQPDWTICDQGDAYACFVGQCEELGENETCDTAIELTMDVSYDGSLDNFHAWKDGSDACSMENLVGQDAYFSFTFEAGETYSITVTPASGLDVALVGWSDCESDAECLMAVDSFGEGEAEIAADIHAEESGTLIVQVIDVTAETNRGEKDFTILVESESVVDGDEDGDLDPDGDLDDVTDGDEEDIPTDGDLDAVTDGDVEDTPTDGDLDDDIEVDGDAPIDGDQDIADGEETVDGDRDDSADGDWDKEDPLTDGDDDESISDGDEPATDGDDWEWAVDGDSPTVDGDTSSGIGGGGGCTSTGSNPGVLMLGLVLMVAVIVRRRKIQLK